MRTGGRVSDMERTREAGYVEMVSGRALVGHPETSERGQQLDGVPRGEEGVIARLVSYVMIRERVTALDLIEMIMGDRERNPGRERGKRVTCENKPRARDSVRKRYSMHP